MLDCADRLQVKCVNVLETITYERNDPVTVFPKCASTVTTVFCGLKASHRHKKKKAPPRDETSSSGGFLHGSQAHKERKKKKAQACLSDDNLGEGEARMAFLNVAPLWTGGQSRDDTGLSCFSNRGI